MGGVSYAYDANGQLGQAGSETYAWNPDGSLQAKNGSYVYGNGGASDGLKRVSGGTTSIYPFGDDYEVTASEVTTYVSAPGLGVVAKLVTSVTATTPYWIHTDRMGSFNVVTNQVGHQELRRTYRAYGETQTQEGTHAESRGYISQRFDAAASLTYLHARYYDPRAGLFVSPDPIGPAGGINGYGYAGGNPTMFVDQTGLAVSNELTDLHPTCPNGSLECDGADALVIRHHRRSSSRRTHHHRDSSRSHLLGDVRLAAMGPWWQRQRFRPGGKWPRDRRRGGGHVPDSFKVDVPD